MRSDWLWDRRISNREVKRIFTDPNNPRYPVLAALLLSRKNKVREVFGDYIKPLDFCRNWSKIKRQMRKDRWNDPRIEFWEAIYERLLDNYRKKGIKIFVKKKNPPHMNFVKKWEIKLEPEGKLWA